MIMEMPRISKTKRLMHVDISDNEIPWKKDTDIHVISRISKENCQEWPWFKFVIGVEVEELGLLGKNLKSISRKKGIFKSHRSVRLEAQSRLKSKSIKSKPQSVRASRRKSSLDSGYDTLSDSGLEDLSMPYRRPKPMPFTSMITRFRYHRRSKLPPYVRVYEGNKDPEDHLSIFFCRSQARGVAHASMVQDVSPDPECSRTKKESAHTKGVPPVLRISAFMHGHGHPELAKKLNDKIPKIVDEIWERVRAFIKGETVVDTTEFIRSPRWEKSAGKASWLENQNRSRNRGHRRGEGRNMGTCAPYDRREGFTPLTKTPKEILAMDNVNFPPPPPMVGTPEKQNINKFCDYHQDRGHNINDCYHLKKQIKEAVASGRLAHLVKDIRQSGQKSKGSAKGKKKVINMVRSQGYRKRPYKKIEHWMDNTIAFLSVPRYQLMDCLVVVDALIEGFRVKRIHVDGGSSLEVMYEQCFRNLSYRTRSRLKESRIPLMGFSGEFNYPLGVIDLEVTMGEYEKTQTVIMEFVVVKSQSSYNALLGRTGMRSLGAVASTIHSMIKFPTSNGIATIATTRETLRECRQIKKAQALSRHARVTDPSPMQTSSEVTNPRVLLAPVETRSRRLGKGPMQLDDMEERHALIHTLQKNIDILAWTPANMTGIPQAITEHSLDTYPYIEPKVQKKRSLAPDRRKVVTDEVNEWLKAGIVRRVRYPSWVANPVLVKEMTKKDKEKTDFHTEEGVFGYTKMPFGLKNAGATYQRRVDSAFKEQIWVNLEAYVDDIVIKITSEGIRANPEKIKAVMDMPLPRTLKQMQSLSGKLEALNRFLSKSDERSLPFLDTLNKCTNKKDFRWTEAAEATFLEMKKMVSELPTLTTIKKGKTLMMYLAAENEAVSVVLLTERDGSSKGSGLGRLSSRHLNRDKCYTRGCQHPKNEGHPESSNARENLTPSPRAWRLYIDRASNNRGSEAGLILIALDDMEYSYALRLNFSNSNNEAEYEALLVGLRIAMEMHVKDIYSFMDSKLVPSQVEG
ncbi:reverse transcriptase domain-containing protein [Tanacetum coccineum]|uniref:Reverse transcriptase domain-containing protein n=1 Tax=Tanacetum coccineum TaxID=301880 RepID=A0ABQ5HFK2_9ASTR